MCLKMWTILSEIPHGLGHLMKEEEEEASTPRLLVPTRPQARPLMQPAGRPLARPLVRGSITIQNIIIIFE